MLTKKERRGREREEIVNKTMSKIKLTIEIPEIE